MVAMARGLPDFTLRRVEHCAQQYFVTWSRKGNRRQGAQRYMRTRAMSPWEMHGGLAALDRGFDAERSWHR
jgi:hypothetical protein